MFTPNGGMCDDFIKRSVELITSSSGEYNLCRTHLCDAVILSANDKALFPRHKSVSFTHIANSPIRFMEA